MTSRSLVRLLLLESHRAIENAIEQLIERQKLPYVLETTATPQEAASRLRQASCDVVLLDGTNGNRRGWTFLENPDCRPVVILVDRESSAAALRAARLGANPCPIDSADDESLALLPALVENAVLEKRRLDDFHERLADLAHLHRVATVSEMAADLAHELAQPLGAISGLAQACRHGVDGLSGEGRDDVIELCSQMVEQAERGSRIVRRVREFVRRADGPRASADLNELIRGVVDLLQAEARPRGVSLELALAEPLPPAVVDRLQIEQVVANLVRNAIDAAETMPPPRRTVTVRSSAASDAGLVVAVEDQAAGLRPEDAARLFKPFRTSKAGGLGLGLWISRSIVESHRGRIDFGPGAQWGTVFQFTLPRGSEGGRR